MMKIFISKHFTYIALMLYMSTRLFAQEDVVSSNILNQKQVNIVKIASLTASGDLSSLKLALHHGLDSKISINQLKEVMVHLYAYCGFPRSIRGLQTLMEVIEERKRKNFQDDVGKDASPIVRPAGKYVSGRRVLSELTGTLPAETVAAYGKFAPVIDTLLKEHLFSDLFERDILTFTERELVTISVLASIGNVEPMLRSHFYICLHLGLTVAQLDDFNHIIHKYISKRKGKKSSMILNELIKKKIPQQ